MLRWQSGAGDDIAYDAIQLGEILVGIEPVLQNEDGTARTERVAISAERNEMVVKLAVKINNRLLNHQMTLLSG